MKHLKPALVSLLIGLTLFFNIERLDFGFENLVDIQTFVYYLGLTAVLLTVLVPHLSRAPVLLSITFWLVAFLLFKLLIFNRPLLGGIYTYLTVTELGLLVLLIWLSYQVGRALHEFREAVEFLMLADTSQRIPKVAEATDLIRREMTRSRHYHRSLSIIVAAPETKGVEISVPRLVKETQQALIQRLATARLAEMMRKELRLVDTVLADQRHTRFIILCPEVDSKGSALLVERIQTAANQQLGIAVECGTASFPNEALTFEELVRHAEADIQHQHHTDTMLARAGLYARVEGSS